MYGSLTHFAINQRSAFGGDFRSDHFSGAVYPNIDHNGAFFADIVAGSVQTFRAATAKAVAGAIAFAAVAFILLDASQSVGFALVAGLTCNSL